MLVDGLAVDIAGVVCWVLVCYAWCVNVLCVVLGFGLLTVSGVMVLVVAGFGCKRGFGFSCFGFRFGVVVNACLWSLLPCEFGVVRFGSVIVAMPIGCRCFWFGCCFFDCLVGFGVLPLAVGFPDFRLLVCAVTSCFGLGLRVILLIARGVSVVFIVDGGLSWISDCDWRLRFRVVGGWWF